jgi:hypothetical protein
MMTPIRGGVSKIRTMVGNTQASNANGISIAMPCERWRRAIVQPLAAKPNHPHQCPRGTEQDGKRNDSSSDCAQRQQRMPANVARRRDDASGRDLSPVPQMRSMPRFFDDVAEQRVDVLRGQQLAKQVHAASGRLVARQPPPNITVSWASW